MWGYKKSSGEKEEKMKARKFRVTGNTCSHCFQIGQIIEPCGFVANGINAKGDMCFGDDEWYVRFSDMEEIFDTKPSFFHRLYTAIIGALFGPESHSRNRY